MTEIIHGTMQISQVLSMSNPDWNFDPLDDECEKCVEEELDECICDEDDWEVEDGDINWD